MREHLHLEDEPGQVRTRRGASEADEPVAQAGAVFDAAARPAGTARGGVPAIGRAIDGLQASAGNGAVARLFGGAASSRHREGHAQVHAARTSTTAPVVQASPDDEAAPEDVNPTGGDTGPVALGAGAPTPGPSWTHIGPPSNTTYDVSGTLRNVANTVAARTEAGSETATPTSDTDTWTPDGGTEKILAARVTVDQVVELPNWTDKANATTNQQAEWDRFYAAIKTHEAGHVSTDKTSFAGAHSKMVGKSPGDGDKALDAVEAQAKTDNETYDTTTKHGLTQGTGINPNIDEVTKVP
jgi:hypothetical protein